ncbi:MAG: hypothetical protein CM1200mP41_09210 [Gammaproteobacteria bacterium]|nr:MAG: hypothetical protein CM1200mP41_09210 [Gammaproteobacteria bacterium]
MNEHWDGDIDVGMYPIAIISRTLVMDWKFRVHPTYPRNCASVTVRTALESTHVFSSIRSLILRSVNIEPYARLPGIDASGIPPFVTLVSFNVESSVNRFDHPVAARTQGLDYIWRLMVR